MSQARNLGRQIGPGKPSRAWATWNRVARGAAVREGVLSGSRSQQIPAAKTLGVSVKTTSFPNISLSVTHVQRWPAPPTSQSGTGRCRGKAGRDPMRPLNRGPRLQQPSTPGKCFDHVLETGGRPSVSNVRYASTLSSEAVRGGGVDRTCLALAPRSRGGSSGTGHSTTAQQRGRSSGTGPSAVL